MDTAPKLEDVTRILREFLPTQYGAVLFGSRATGRAQPGSDWDIGVIGATPLDGGVLELIREGLEELPTLHTFDVVDLVRVPEWFRKSAIRGARAILPAAALEQYAEEITMPASDGVELSAFESALKRFSEVLAMPESDVVRDAAIQRFEFTFEMAWKTTRRTALKAGIECGASPREVIRAALKIGWIEDDQLWIKMLDDRNMTSHTYDEVDAKLVYSRLPNYIPLLTKLLERLEKVLAPLASTNDDTE
jgi:nucleotidyltransferase substrate binding protein (TIGR01987 family)